MPQLHHRKQQSNSSYSRLKKPQDNHMTKFFLTLFLSLSVSLNAVQKPNILIIIADDCTFSDLPINGGQNAKTPHLDTFAKQ